MTEDALKPLLIARIWQSRTRTALTEEYTRYLYENGVCKIARIEGNRGVQMLRQPMGEETEFTVISYWDGIDGIKRFAGEDYEKTHHLPRDHQFLVKLEPAVRHLEVIANEWPSLSR
jgi:heme-degrading monooxygenase HmoA